MLEASLGQPYSYDVEAMTDPDAGDTLTFNLVTSPAEHGNRSGLGLINWTKAMPGGDNAVEVRVTDGGGLSARSFTVKVDDVSRRHQSITSGPVLGATQDQPYSYDVEATDRDVGDTLTFSLDMAHRPGMAIDPTSGLVTGHRPMPRWAIAR